MTKKKYSTPSTSPIVIETLSILASSPNNKPGENVTINNETSYDGEWFSNKKIWK